MNGDHVNKERASGNALFPAKTTPSIICPVTVVNAPAQSNVCPMNEPFSRH